MRKPFSEAFYYTNVVASAFNATSETDVNNVSMVCAPDVRLIRRTYPSVCKMSCTDGNCLSMQTMELNGLACIFAYSHYLRQSVKNNGVYVSDARKCDTEGDTELYMATIRFQGSTGNLDFVTEGSLAVYVNSEGMITIMELFLQN